LGQPTVTPEGVHTIGLLKGTGCGLALLECPQEYPQFLGFEREHLPHELPDRYTYSLGKLLIGCVDLST
jgi:hypothetical protein